MSAGQRYRVSQQTTPCVIQPRDQALLVDLYLQRVLTRDQVIGLNHFRTVVRCNARLRKLASVGYLAKLTFAARGSGSQTVWCLGKGAAKIVADQLDTDVGNIARAVASPVPAALLDHTLLLTDTRIWFERAATRGSVARFRWASEALCRHEYVSAGRQWIIKPDGFVEWQGATGWRRFFVEVDLGNVSRAEFKSKCEGYVHYGASGAFQDVYGEPGFGVLVFTTGHRRLAHLAAVAEAAGLREFHLSRLSALRDDESFADLWHQLQSVSIKRARAS